MRIAMVSTPFVAVPPPEYGGTELVVYELVEGLIDRGHDVTLFATGDSHTRARLQALYPTPKWPPDQLTELNHVSWALSRVAGGDYDLAHVHSASALAVGRLMPSVPLVYTIHHSQVPGLSEFYREFPEVHGVAISADQLARETGLPRSQVIHHGLDPSRYDWTHHPGEYVCFVGRFAPEKGLETAVDAARMAGVPIEIGGGVHPHDREYFNREIEPRLRAPGVRHLGWVDAGRKRALLRNARALLAPIAWDEPFGLILVEAMLSGCPVVAFARGSVPELVEQGVTGFIAGSVDEMAGLIRPGGPVDRLDRGRIRAVAEDRFGRDRMVDAHERLYGAVAQRGRRPPVGRTAA
jgi:glycosyltransferase involved in cell wall biosynthesis